MSMKINWEKVNGLLPAIVQDAESNQVLMLGYMNEESLDLTLKSGKVTFYSRSRQSLWQKGETSGNVLNVVNYAFDCDQDAILIKVNPVGPTCHRGTTTCFDSSLHFLEELQGIIDSRISSGDSKSYVAKLVESGLDRVAQKVGEEAIETVIASKNNDKADFENEASDLLFHLMILLKLKDSSLPDLAKLLESRHKSR